MMQLPKPDLEAMMLAIETGDSMGLAKQTLNQDSPGADHKPPLTLLESSGQVSDRNSAEKPIMAQDILFDQGHDETLDEDKEKPLPMFRSEEEAFEATQEFPDSIMAASSLHDRLSLESDSLGASHSTPSNAGNPGPGGSNGMEPEPGFLPVLKNRDFLTLWGGQVFSQLADKVYLVLMIALIASRFQSEDQTISGWVSSIMIAFTIPAVLFGSIAGVYVDRWSKKTVLVITNLLRGGLVFTLLPLLWLSKGWGNWFGGLPAGFCILLGITFLVSTLTQFFAPAEQSTIPLIVERRHLLSANSLYTTTMMASVIIGFAVGEPLLAIADALTAQLGLTSVGLGKEIVVGSGYVIAGLILLMLKVKEKPRTASSSNHLTVPQAPDLITTGNTTAGNTATTHSASTTKTSPGSPTDDGPVEYPHVFEDIRDGLRYLSQQPRVRSAMLQLVLLFSVFAALAVLSVRLAEVIPEIKSSQFGFLLAAGGVGMAIGAAFVGQFGQRFPHSRLSLSGSLGMAAALFGLALFSGRLVPALLLIMLLGLFSAVVGVPMQTTIQEETPEDIRGKVFGLQNNAINIALSLPLALAGVAETFFGLQTVFLALSGLMVTGGVLNWYIPYIKTKKTSNSR